jgi:hypothetical protein
MESTDGPKPGTLHTIQGRLIGAEEITAICELIRHNPTQHRRWLSEELARMWHWQTATGQLKNFAAYSLLLKLDRRGWIVLPPPRRAPTRRRPMDTTPDLLDLTTSEPIEGLLAVLCPIRIAVLTPRTMKRLQRLLARYHYLGFGGPVGENIAYQVTDRSGRDLACVLFGAAAWKVAARDTWIGWSPERRAQGIQRIANNSRFLVLPWVRVPHLASHILGRISRRIASDWQTKYGHPIDLLETFVDRARFRGTCYRAANWIHVGSTQGRSRQDRTHSLQVPVKDIYVYPLRTDVRERLLHG